jgi:hypothetical protein
MNSPVISPIVKFTQADIAKLYNPQSFAYKSIDKLNWIILNYEDTTIYTTTIKNITLNVKLSDTL